MNILIADRVDKESIRQLQDLGYQVDYKADLEGHDLVQAVQQVRCQVLVVRGTRVTAEAIRANKELSLIVRVGDDTDAIDLDAASAESVFVATCPGKNSAAVAELTMGLILALDRRLADSVNDMRQGRWSQREYSKARGLKGRTLGVLGMGSVGEAVVQRAKAFEMNVVGWSPRLTSERASQLGMVRLDLPEEVAATCDVLSVHVALTPDTYQMVSSNIFEEMRARSMFINTSRPEIVDYDALAQAVVEKSLLVGLDTYPHEPAVDGDPFQCPLFGLSGVVYGTPHVGYSTDEARAAASDEMVRIVKTYVGTGEVLNCVNMSRGKVPHGVLVVRLRNCPGILAKVLTLLARHGLNVREMDNIMCRGDLSASAQIRLDSKPTPDVLRELEQLDTENILGVTLTHPGY